VGADDEGGRPNRTGLGEHEREIEAEAVAYLVCSRGGIVPASVQYLKAHAGKADLRFSSSPLSKKGKDHDETQHKPVPKRALGKQPR
jgi:hypothetical protein